MRLHGGVGSGRGTQQLGELVLRIVVEVVLPAKEDHLVFEKCLPDEGNRRRVEMPAESDSVDSGADMRAEGGDSAASGVNGGSVR